MLDRRSFLGSLLAAPAVAAAVPDAEPPVTDTNYVVRVEPAGGPDPKPEAKPGGLTLEFPGGVLLVPTGEGFSASVPFRRDAFGRVVREPCCVTATRVVCPDAVWAEFVRTYRDVTPDPTIVARLRAEDGRDVTCSLDHAVLTGFGGAASAGGMVVVENLRLLCVWREQEENIKAYLAGEEAARREHEAEIVPADDDEPAECFCDLCAGYDDPPAEG